MIQVVAVLDANVLLPAPLRDTLLRAAAAGLYQQLWSEDILEEVRRNLLAKWGLTEAQTQKLLNAMREYFPDAIVADYTLLIETMTNDPKDRHVLAAAVASGARIIVTHNLRDFPADALAPFNVIAQSPDTFLEGLFSLDAEAMVGIIQEQADDLRNPPKTADELLDMLAIHAPRFAGLVRQAIHGD